LAEIVIGLVKRRPPKKKFTANYISISGDPAQRFHAGHEGISVSIFNAFFRPRSVSIFRGKNECLRALKFGRTRRA
jgi:hypothetical protein